FGQLCYTCGRRAPKGGEDAAACLSRPFPFWNREDENMLDFLEKEEAVSPALLREVEAFREANPLAEGLRTRIPVPRYHYYGREIWEQAIAALLCGKNLLLTGGKATGKNVLAENLAAAFGRPA